jgi:hypothetical protein
MGRSREPVDVSGYDAQINFYRISFLTIRFQARNRRARRSRPVAAWQIIESLRYFRIAISNTSGFDGEDNGLNVDGAAFLNGNIVIARLQVVGHLDHDFS